MWVDTFTLWVIKLETEVNLCRSKMKAVCIFLIQIENVFKPFSLMISVMDKGFFFRFVPPNFKIFI